MGQLIHQPHDKLFKQSLTDIRVARDFFEAHLPPQIRHTVDLNTLKLQKNTFISPDYKSSEADVLYTVKLEDSTAYFYLLLEQQSTVDPMMSFRLLCYIVRILEMHYKQHPKAPLPPIYPIVLYAGEELWSAPLDVFELFGGQKEHAKKWLISPYNLVDVNRISDDELQKHLWCGLMECLLKYRQATDFSGLLEKILPWLQKIERKDGANFGKIVLEYLVDGIDAEDSDLFVQKSAHYLSSELRSEVMTLSQKFRQQGMEEKSIEIARSMLKKGMPIDVISEITGLSVNLVKKLKSGKL